GAGVRGVDRRRLAARAVVGRARGRRARPRAARQRCALVREPRARRGLRRARGPPPARRRAVGRRRRRGGGLGRRPGCAGAAVAAAARRPRRAAAGGGPRGAAVVGFVVRRGGGLVSVPVTLVWLEGAAGSAAAGVHLDGTLRRLAALGADVHRVVAWRGGPGGRVRRLARLLVGAVRQPRCGVVLVRWHPFALPALVAARLRGGACVVSAQGVLAEVEAVHPWIGRHRVARRLALLPLELADHVVAPSAGIARWVVEVTGRPAHEVTVLANGTDVGLFAAERRPPDEPPYAVFVGNLAPWQGVGDLVAAARRPEWPQGLRLVVVGDGVERPAVQAAADAGVEWCGTLDRAAVARVLGGATLAFATRGAVAASARGTSPFKVVEAAAAGVPVVATDVPGQ